MMITLRRRFASRNFISSLKQDWLSRVSFSSSASISNSKVVLLTSNHLRCTQRKLSTSPSHSKSSLPYGAYDSDDDNEDAVRIEEVAAAVEEEDLYDLAQKQTFFLNDYYKHPVNLNRTNVFQRGEGGYIELDPNDIKKYMPEGLAGDAADEFEFSGQKCWMIRNSSKVLCRLLDSFVNDLELHKINKNVVPKVSVVGLTDRPEWTLAMSSVTHYGKELLQQMAETGLEVTQGEGSVVDDALPAFTSAVKLGSKNIMITGACALFGNSIAVMISPLFPMVPLFLSGFICTITH